MTMTDEREWDKRGFPADRLLINLTSPQVHAIYQLRDYGYGDGKTPASVIEYMVERFIDDLRRAGVVKPIPVDPE